MRAAADRASGTEETAVEVAAGMSISVRGEQG